MKFTYYVSLSILYQKYYWFVNTNLFNPFMYIQANAHQIQNLVGPFHHHGPWVSSTVMSQFSIKIFLALVKTYMYHPNSHVSDFSPVCRGIRRRCKFPLSVYKVSVYKTRVEFYFLL